MQGTPRHGCCRSVCAALLPYQLGWRPPGIYEKYGSSPFVIRADSYLLHSDQGRWHQQRQAGGGVAVLRFARGWWLGMGLCPCLAASRGAQPVSPRELSQRPATQPSGFSGLGCVAGDGRPQGCKPTAKFPDSRLSTGVRPHRPNLTPSQSNTGPDSVTTRCRPVLRMHIAFKKGGSL